MIRRAATRTRAAVVDISPTPSLAISSSSSFSSFAAFSDPTSGGGCVHRVRCGGLGAKPAQLMRGRHLLELGPRQAGHGQPEHAPASRPERLFVSCRGEEEGGRLKGIEESASLLASEARKKVASEPRKEQNKWVTEGRGMVFLLRSESRLKGKHD
jgi:hypothetical protein